jgi:hypothetical protein
MKKGFQLSDDEDNNDGGIDEEYIDDEYEDKPKQK